jgi:hypothetical protein
LIRVSGAVRLLEYLAAIDAVTSDQDAAQALETLDLKPRLAQLKSNHLMQQILALASEDEEATVTGLTRLINSLADEGKSSLIAAIQSRLSGTFTLFDEMATNGKRCLGPPSYSN